MICSNPQRDQIKEFEKDAVILHTKISVNEQKLAAKVVQRGNEKVSYCVCHLESLAVNSGHRGKSM